MSVLILAPTCQSVLNFFILSQQDMLSLCSMLMLRKNEKVQHQLACGRQDQNTHLRPPDP